MTDNIVAALLIGVAIVLGALALGGRYTTSQGTGGLFVIDRFTGAVIACAPKECRPVTWTPISLPPDKLPPPKAKGG